MIAMWTCAAFLAANEPVLDATPILVQYFNQGSQEWETVPGFPEVGVPSGSDINITGTSLQDWHYRIREENPNTEDDPDIGRIYLEGSAGTAFPVRIQIGRDPSVNETINNDIGNYTTGAIDFYGIEIGPNVGEVQLAGKIEGSIVGDIDVDWLWNFSAGASTEGGSVDADFAFGNTGTPPQVIIDDVPQTPDGRITADGISVAGSITLNGQTSKGITMSGPMAGSIYLFNSRLESLFFNSGASATGDIIGLNSTVSVITVQAAGDFFSGTIDIEPPTGENSLSVLDVAGTLGRKDPATGVITKAVIRTGGNIQKITATEIWADIDATAYDVLGTVQELRTSSGDFVGSLRVNRFSSNVPGAGIHVEGVFDGRIEINENPATGLGGQQTNPFNFASMCEDSFISLDRGISEDWTLDALGLKGNVVLNADNNTTGTSGFAPNDEIWLGTVPNQTVLNQLEYPTSSTLLGGGAVGAPPFTFHPIDCEPNYLAELPGAPSEIIIEYYGPIIEKDDDPALPNITPYIIQRAQRDLIPTN